MRNKTLPRIFAIALAIVLIVVPFLPARLDISSTGLLSISLSQVQASPDWLTGYDYRKEITIDGSSAGAQTDYQMQLTAYKYAAPIGDDCMARALGSSYPVAYYYNGKTYVVWQGTDLDPYIDCYNNSTGAWQGAVQVGTNPLSNDFHGTPSLIVDDSGYIHVFYGCHSTGAPHIKHAKSTNSEDISAWTAQSDIDLTSGASYPCPVKDSDGYIWLFARDNVSIGDSNTKTPEAYRKSTDSGASWGSVVTAIEADDVASEGIYMGNPAYDATNERIHFAWTYQQTDPTTIRLNVYHAYLDTSDAHFYTMGGTDLGTSISTSEADTYCKIVSETTYDIDYRCKTQLDSSGNPYVIYIRFESPYTAYFVYWNGSAWTTPVAIDTSAETGDGTFFVTASDDITAYLPVEDGGGHALEKWTWNGSIWAKDSTVLSSAEIVCEDGVRVATDVLDGQSGLTVLLSTQDTDDYTNNDLRVFGINSSDAVVAGYGKIGLEGNCQADFDDIRFTQSDGETELDHFRQEYVSEDYAIFWTEFNSIAASPDSATFYIYYDNAEASSGSSEPDTFTQRDDFEWGSDEQNLDPSSGNVEWAVIAAGSSTVKIDTAYAYSGTRSVRLHRDGTNTPAADISQVPFDYTIDFWLRVDNNGSALKIWHGNGSKRILFVYTAHASPELQYSNGSEYVGTGVYITRETWIEVTIANIDWDAGTYDIYHNHVLVAEGLTMGATAFTANILKFQDSAAGTSDIWLDDVVVRQWCDPEPTWGGFGSEEGFNPEITNTPDNIDFGILEVNTTGNTAINYFTIENIGNCAVDVTIQGTNATGGDDTWELSDTATPGENIYGLYAGLDDDDDLFDVIVKKTATYNTLVSDLAEDATQDWGLKIYVPTSLSGYDGQEMTGTITLVASESP